MGKKKSFIDKKNSTTYSLIYRSQDDVNDDPDKAERVLLPADKVGVPDPEKAASGGGRWPAGHPLAWLEAEHTNRVGDDARRREIVSLGLPDDGYDYLKHMRVVGGGGTSSMVEVPAGEKEKQKQGDTISLVDEVAGPSVFVPATRQSKSQAVRDEKMLDASKLVVRSKAEDDDGAEQLASGITAFSKEMKSIKGPSKEELSEVAAALAALEEDDDEGHFDAEALDDEFVLQATEWTAPEGVDDEDEDDEDGEEFSSGIESGDEDDDDEEDGIRGYPGYRGDGVSLASSYWRKERSDRNENLAMIDERFERLAFQYDEDQIGELDDEADEGELAGASDISHFGGILDEFIEKNKALMPGGSGDPDRDEEAEARQIAKKYAKDDDGDEDGDAQGDPIALLYHDKPKEQWDCESVLSLRSNLDNHPGRIEEPRKKAASGSSKIKLSSKTGLPVLVEGGHEEDEESDDESIGFSVASTMRRKDESAEEKKARKAAVKEAQRHARARKKELKTMFKEEKGKMKKLVTTHRTMPLA